MRNEFNLKAAIEAYAEELGKTVGKFNVKNILTGQVNLKNILSRSPYPWDPKCPPMISLFEYFDEIQINNFLETNIENIDGTAFSAVLKTSSGSRINALSVAKEKGYHKAYIMGFSCITETRQTQYLQDIKDIFERFLSVNDYQSIFEYIQHVPKIFKCNILKRKTKDGLTPLHQAVDNENTDTVKLILEGTSPGQKLSVDQKFDLLNIKNNRGWTPLYQAIRNKMHDDNKNKIELLMRDLSRDQYSSYSK